MKPLIAQLIVDNSMLTFEVDTGAAVSLMGEHSFQKHCPEDRAPPLHKSSSTLHTYTGEEIPMLRIVDVSVKSPRD